MLWYVWYITSSEPRGRPRWCKEQNENREQKAHRCCYHILIYRTAEKKDKGGHTAAKSGHVKFWSVLLNVYKMISSASSCVIHFSSEVLHSADSCVQDIAHKSCISALHQSQPGITRFTIKQHLRERQLPDWTPRCKATAEKSLLFNTVIDVGA